MTDKKTIAILTSGGDAPGMNCAIRAVVRNSIKHGYRVIGFYRGYHGLLYNNYTEMGLRTVSDILHRGGTILYSSRCPEFALPENLDKAVQNCRDLGVDALVAIGGDGTFKGALELSRRGVPCIGIPATIDNDISVSDYTIGFDTALNTVVQMVDRIRDTSQSHDRCTVVEVMGRNSGHIALHSGLVCGALAILVPEIQYDLESEVIGKMKETLAAGKKHFIVMVAEGAGSAEHISAFIEERTGIEARAIVLGHVQRGGSPTYKERIVASCMGHNAVEIIMQGKSARVIAYKGEGIADFDIEEALAMHKSIDMELYRVALDINI